MYVNRYSYRSSSFSPSDAVICIDDPELFSNAPVGLQLVGLPEEDEAVIRMTEIVDAALKGFDTPNMTPVNRLLASLQSWSTWVLPHGLPLISSLTGDAEKLGWRS